VNVHTYRAFAELIVRLRIVSVGLVPVVLGQTIYVLTGAVFRFRYELLHIGWFINSLPIIMISMINAQSPLLRFLWGSEWFPKLLRKIGGGSDISTTPHSNDNVSAKITTDAVTEPSVMLASIDIRTLTADSDAAAAAAEAN
jgi:hypothetical protein